MLLAGAKNPWKEDISPATMAEQRGLELTSATVCRSAMDGRKSSSDFGIRTYFDMFQKMEDTFKFCAECKKLPDALPDPKSLRRCKRYGGGEGGLVARGWIHPLASSPVAGVKLGTSGPDTHLHLPPKTGMGVAGSHAWGAESCPHPPPWLGMLPLSPGARTCTTAAWRASVPTGRCTRSSARS